MSFSKKSIKRFWSKVDIRNDAECWNFTGSIKSTGYGQIYMDGKNQSAHRVSQILACGFNLPSTVCVCHKCDNPKCVNPNHLFVGSVNDNIQDMHAKGRANKAKGSTSAKAKVNEEEVKNIRYLYKKMALTQRQIANIFGLAHQTISNIVNKKTWKHVA